MKILISTSSFAAEDRRPLDLLEAHGVQYELNPYGRKLTEEESIALLNDKEGVLAGTEKLSAYVLNNVNKLKVISRCGTGTDNVDMQVATARNIRVLNTPDVHVLAVAELALAGILSALRRLPVSTREMMAGNWNKRMGRNLTGMTIGIIGFGKVGRKLVELLKAFNCKVLAYDPMLGDEVFENYGVKKAELTVMAAEVDIVSLHLPYSKEVQHLVGKDFFANAKEELLLINTARGGLVDENALYEFLVKQPGSTAYLDTFETEPYVGKLATLDNCILSPHIGTFTRETRVAMEVEACMNLINFIKQEA